MSKKEPSPKPALALAGKGVTGAHLGRRYDPETHQWVEDAPAAEPASQPAPEGEKGIDHAAL